MKSLNDLKEYAKINYVPILREKSSVFLSDFCVENKPKKILEIGTAIGYSSLLMAKAVPNSTILTIEKNDKMVEIANINIKDFGKNQQISVIQGDAIDVLPTIKDSFDLIFLDGPKGQYYKYLPIIIKMLNKSGSIIADNIDCRGMIQMEVIPHKFRTYVMNMRKFISALKNNSEIDYKYYQIEDGIMVINFKKSIIE